MYKSQFSHNDQTSQPTRGFFLSTPSDRTSQSTPKTGHALEPTLLVR
jgi:hypothetical protein